MNKKKKFGKRKKIPVDQLIIDPFNVRGDDIEYEEDDFLAEDVFREGVEQNILVRPLEYVNMWSNEKLKELFDEGYRYSVIAGGRRLRACKKKGIKKKITSYY